MTHASLRRLAKLRRQRRARAGFSLVELMVVIVILGLLATVVVLNVLPARDRAMVEKAGVDVAMLESAIDTYRLDNLTYPPSLEALVEAPAGLERPDRYRAGGYVRDLPEDPWGNHLSVPPAGPARRSRHLVVRRRRPGGRRGP